MDTIKLLGDLLGNKQMSRGMGQKILESILTGGGGAPSGSAPPQRAPQSAPQRQPSVGDGGLLGGLLRQAVEQFVKQGQDQPTGQRAPQAEQRPSFEGPGSGVPDLGGPHRGGSDRERTRTFADDRNEASRQAETLIRAMVTAAKADGQVDETEQQSIISRMGHLSQEEINFLRQEFAKSLDAKQFAEEVPRGLEEEVYAISLTAIDLDTNREARYLHELATALRLTPDECNQIHSQLGAPVIYA